MKRIVASVRMQVESREQAEEVSRLLSAVLGDAIQLTTPHQGRGKGVWFVRGTLRTDLIAATTPRFVEAILRDTGELVSIPDPRPQPHQESDPASARRLSRLAGLTRPVSQPDDGIDRREAHRRLRERQEAEKAEEKEGGAS
jgi:hypothetical protein